MTAPKGPTLAWGGSVLVSSSSSPEIHSEPPLRLDRLGRAGIRALAASRLALRLVEDGKSPESWRKLGHDVRISDRSRSLSPSGLE